jgi:hypothetical protein
MRTLSLFAILALTGCSAMWPDGRLACDGDDECPAPQRCDLGTHRCRLAVNDAGVATDASGDAYVLDAGLDAAEPLDAGEPRDAIADALDAALPRDAFAADAWTSDPSPPRPISPLSTSTSTSRRPTLTWELPLGTDGAHVEICADRACTSLAIAAFDAPGTSITLASDLPIGVVWFRLFGRAGTTTGSTPSPTWQMTIGARSAAHDASWGTTLDVNGDGHGDLAASTPRWSADRGRVHVYYGAGVGLPTTPNVSLEVSGTSALFGTAIASAGDVDGDGYGDLVVGAPGREHAYVYVGGPGGLGTSAAFPIATPDAAGGLFGRTVASAGDVDGDGYADLAIGAPNESSGEGRVHVYLGGPLGPSLTPSTSLVGPAGAGGHFGGAVASAGDVNGDGYGDLIVGAADVTSATGAAYVYLGSATGLADSPDLTLVGPDGPNGGFGRSVACAGDVDGDGYSDVAVGADTYDMLTGRVHLYLGDAAGLPATPSRSLTGPDGVDAQFGFSLATAGDVDGDGYDDLIVSAYGTSAGAGTVYFYRGSSAGLGFSATALHGTEAAPADFGFALAGIGDIEGDGFADVAIAAPGAPGLYLFGGHTTVGLIASSYTRITSPDIPTTDGFGAALAGRN